MGTATANFYIRRLQPPGPVAEVAAQVRERWQAGDDRDGAAALVTDDMVLATTLIGTEDMVRARLRAWREAGGWTPSASTPAGDTLTARLDTLARGIATGPVARISVLKSKPYGIFRQIWDITATLETP